MNPAMYNNKATEFFTWNGELNVIHNQTIYTFDNAPLSAIDVLAEALENDKRASDGLTLLGITEPIERLRKFGMCRYGGMSDQADFGCGSKDDCLINCSQKYTCKGYGLVCKRKFNIGGEFLSTREVEIGASLATGKSPEQIAEELYVEPITIRSTLNHIKQKLHLQNYSAVSSFFSRSMMNTL